MHTCIEPLTPLKSLSVLTFLALIQKINASEKKLSPGLENDPSKGSRTEGSMGDASKRHCLTGLRGRRRSTLPSERLDMKQWQICRRARHGDLRENSSGVWGVGTVGGSSWVATGNFWS